MEKKITDQIEHDIEKSFIDIWEKMRNIEDPDILSDEERNAMLIIHYGVLEDE